MAYFSAIFYEFCLQVLKDLDWSVVEDCTGCQKCFLDMITLGNLAY